MLALIAQVETTFAGDGSVNGGRILFLHPDHLNTPRLATNSGQSVQWSWNSDAYGYTAPNEDVDGDGVKTSVALRFPGQVYDVASQLYYNYYRDYNPETGRYVQSDPIGLAGGINTYGYVRGNPVGRVDPLGLVDIYVGGAGDGTTKIVSSWVDKNASGSPYFEWTQGSELSEYISKVPANEPINLYGHSYGGDTAAWAAMRAGGESIH